MTNMHKESNIVTARTEDLNESERQEITSVCIAAHNEPSFANLFNWVSDGLHVVAKHAGTIIGHAMVTTRWVQPEGNPIMETAYIDAVSVSPEYHSKGVGTAVMQRIAESIDGYQIACLETSRPSFYEHLGWERWQGPKAGRRGSELIPTPDEQHVMILRLPKTPNLDLNGLLTIEDQIARIW